jgi:TonB family protein
MMLMRCKVLTFLAVLALAGMAILPAMVVSAQAHSERKATTKVAPVYPDLARRMHVQGSVKLELVVKADGGIKSTRVIGGNPVLIQAATDAVTQWKFQTSPSETTEIVQLTFQP